MQRRTSLDAFANVKAIAFDKTGTLTRGKPAVTDVHLLLDEPFIPNWSSDGKQSNHPLAEAILAYFHDEKPLELAVKNKRGRSSRHLPLPIGRLEKKSI